LARRGDHTGRKVCDYPCRGAFAQGLGPADEVALEVTGNTWAIATVLASRAGRVVVSNPAKTRAIAEAKVKTDKVDGRDPGAVASLRLPALGVVARCGDQRAAPPSVASGAPRSSQSYRDVEELLAERGIEVDHATRQPQRRIHD
jgi:hypothetical protein